MPSMGRPAGDSGNGRFNAFPGCIPYNTVIRKADRYICFVFIPLLESRKIRSYPITVIFYVLFYYLQAAGLKEEEKIIQP